MNQTIQKFKKSVVEMENQDGVYKKKKSFFLKRLWDSYIKRLNKITNGKPQCCK